MWYELYFYVYSTIGCYYDLLLFLDLPPFFPAVLFSGIGLMPNMTVAHLFKNKRALCFFLKRIVSVFI